jgi:hypothetical protein
MSKLAHTAFDLPDATTLEFFPLDDLQSPVLKGAAEYWLQLRGTRRFPSRDELMPSRFSSALRHMALVRVIDGGADFEYRIVGETLAGAFSVPLPFRMLGEINTTAPSTAAVIGRVYQRSLQAGEPLGVRGVTGRDSRTATFTHFESLVLPLGAVETEVDHLLTFMLYELRTS